MLENVQKCIFNRGWLSSMKERKPFGRDLVTDDISYAKFRYSTEGVNSSCWELICWHWRVFSVERVNGKTGQKKDYSWSGYDDQVWVRWAYPMAELADINKRTGWECNIIFTFSIFCCWFFLFPILPHDFVFQPCAIQEVTRNIWDALSSSRRNSIQMWIHSWIFIMQFVCSFDDVQPFRIAFIFIQCWARFFAAFVSITIAFYVSSLWIYGLEHDLFLWIFWCLCVNFVVVVVNIDDLSNVRTGVEWP